MKRKREFIKWQEYTLLSLRAELLGAGKNLTKKTIEKKVREGRFGVVEWLKGGDRFMLKSNAIDNFLNPPLKRQKQEKDDRKTVIRPRYTEDRARDLAGKRVESEIKDRAKWVKENDIETETFEEEKERRLEAYTRMKMQEIEMEKVTQEDLEEQANVIDEYPQDTLNYIATRYNTTAEREFFLVRYLQFLKEFKLDIENPIHDMILRNAIDDELKINHLRWLLSAQLVDEETNSALDKATKRWSELVGSLGLLFRRRASIPETPKETETETKEELYTEDSAKKQGRVIG